jgi:hypothetical protein
LCPKQLFFFSLPQKLVVRGLILEKFPESIMSFIYLILGMGGKFGNFTIVQKLFFCFFFYVIFINFMPQRKMG